MQAPTLFGENLSCKVEVVKDTKTYIHRGFLFLNKIILPHEDLTNDYGGPY